jgi:hypothetical protein
MCSTFCAFAALKENGMVVVWGAGQAGDPKLVFQLHENPTDVFREIQSGVVKLIATACGFAALKSDGRVVRWRNGSTPPIQSGFVDIVIIKIKNDGTQIEVF